MSSRNLALLAIAATLSAFAFTQTSFAGGLVRGGAVGGIMINAEGVIRLPSDKEQAAALARLRESVKKPGADLVTPVPLRSVSLKGLQAAIASHLSANQPLPDEIMFLAGLQRIEYVFVYPERQDIVLAGPAEGWHVDERGEVVGITTGRPVLRLDDLLVALRSVEAARQGGISVSIDPTPEGRKELTKLLNEQRRGPTTAAELPVLERRMKRAFGPQLVTIKGVPATSHFARVLVAADYQMKRLAMDLDKAPIARFPSYVQMIKNGVPSENPRWWLACNYAPLAKSEDELAWQLRGPGVKALSEDELAAADGTVRGTGKSSEAAARWAEMMTERFEELSDQLPALAKVRNLMDMCVVAALIEGYDLRGRAACQLPLLYSADSNLNVQAWEAPRMVPPECSFLKSRKGWVVTASGGVAVESWRVASKAETVGKLAQTHAARKPADNRWWWN